MSMVNRIGAVTVRAEPAFKLQANSWLSPSIASLKLHRPILANACGF